MWGSSTELVLPQQRTQRKIGVKDQRQGMALRQYDPKSKIQSPKSRAKHWKDTKSERHIPMVTSPS
jgi:hypothetical protein